ncbi:1623_t:CDS:2, partial [Ambispora leptoticha]
MSIEFTSAEQNISSTLPILDATNQEPELTLTSEQTTTIQNAQNDLVFGSVVSGMTGKLVEYPFDTVKVRLQTQPIFKGPLDCFRQTFRHEGFLGFYRGLSAPMVGAMVENAVLFTSYNYIQMMIREYRTPKHERHLIHEIGLEKSPLEIRELFLAGAIAGTLASFLLTPIELIKCKLQVQNSLNYNTLPSSNNIIIKNISHIGSNNIMNNNSNYAGIQRTSSSSLRHPNLISATLKTKTPPQNTNPPSFDSPMSAIQHTLKENGIRGFFRGIFPTILRESIGSGVWFGTYEYVTQLFIRYKQSRLLGSIHEDVVITKSDLNPLHSMTAGALAGIGYNVSSFPADSIKSVMQTEKDIEKRYVKSSFFQAGKYIYKTWGIPGFYRGCGITMARAVPSNAIIFMTY